MKIKNNILRNIKESLNQAFLFIPVSGSFFKIYIGVCLEFFFKDRLSRLATEVTNELIEKKVLAPQTLKSFSFSFKKETFYDFYLKNYDGRTYSRGFSLDINEAFAKTLGEVFERQFTEFPSNPSSVRYSSIKGLIEKGNRFIDPSTYSQATEKQIAAFPEVFKCDEETILGWVKVKDILSGEEVYALGQDAFWGFGYNEIEPRLSSLGTNGCGGGYSMEQAINSALLEILQRDTFFRYWYFKKKPNKIDLQTIPSNSNASLLIQNLNREGFIVHILDMSDIAGFPTITAIIKRPHTGWFLGASSSFSKVGAINRALEEAFSIYTWTFQQARSGSYELNDFLEKPVMNDFLDERIKSQQRCLLWGSEFYLDLQDQFLIEGDIIPFYDKSSSNNFSLKEFLVRKYGNGYIASSEDSLLSEYGYYAVKVFFPKAYMLILTEKYARPVLNNIYPHNVQPHPFP